MENVLVYNSSVKEVLENFKVDPKRGLSDEEVRARLQKYGYNELKEKEKLSKFKIFIGQFRSFIVYILLFALVISLFISEFVDAIVIFVILLLNAVLGFIQEYRAEKAIAALKKLSSLKARVIRDGRICMIETKELVPGDVLFMEEGTKLSADGRLIDATMLQTLESSLTGESSGVSKMIEALKGELPLAERKNMVFAGTVMIGGKGIMVVTATGMNTEIGKIAGMITEVKKEITPLQKKLERLGKVFGIGTILIAFVILIVGLIKDNLLSLLLDGNFNGFLMGAETWLITAVALAVAAVPEGLPAIVTITLAIGTKKMLRKNALIRKLPSVETLGDVSIICSDKTGTLTENKMTVRKVFTNNKEIELSGTGYSFEGELKSTKKIDKNDVLVFQVGALCNNSSFEKRNDSVEVIGDPTEAALLISAQKAKVNYSEMMSLWTRVKEIPFDSLKKMMTTVNLDPKTKKMYVFSKGAPEVILGRCNRIYVNGRSRILTKGDKELILKKNDEFSGQSLRVLGFAYKEVKGKDNLESNLIFVGLQGMIDPPRQDVKESISKCKEAGIRVIMITGDNIHTAEGIAREIGIEGNSMNGLDFAKLNETGQMRVLEKTSVFARVEPAHKMIIVTLLQKRGEIVAMTGDGVNDAPAIKKADIGIAMGITGTDVTKETSDMILEDDNFASIVGAVEEGRGVKENIRKFVNYLLSSNLAEVFVIFFALLFSWPLPMTAVMLLWLNLVTDGLPALALGVDPNPKDLMKQPARKREKILNKLTVMKILCMSILMTAGVLVLFYLSMKNYSGLAEAVFIAKIQTIAFTTIVLMEIVRIQSIRQEYKLGIFSNKYLILALLSSVVLQLAVIYTPLSALFGTTVLSLYDWAYIIGTIIIVFILNGLALWIIKRAVKSS